MLVVATIDLTNKRLMLKLYEMWVMARVLFA